MKLHRQLIALAAVGLFSALVADVHADGIGGRPGFPSFGGPRFGRSFHSGSLHGRSLNGGSLYGLRGPTSLYGLGRLFVPPHFAIHPPVYYSLPQARPYGHSPFAYSGDYHPQVVTRRIVVNPHIEAVPLPTPAESPAETTTSTARVIANPYYSPNHRAEASLASQVE